MTHHFLFIFFKIFKQSELIFWNFVTKKIEVIYYQGDTAMNKRLIVFSGMTMAILGSVFGLAVAKMQQKPYQCCGNIALERDFGYSQSRTPGRYATAGAIMGFGIGSIVESLRQLKPEESEL